MTFLFTNVWKHTTLRIFLETVREYRLWPGGLKAFVGGGRAWNRRKGSAGGGGVKGEFLLFILEWFFSPKHEALIPKIDKPCPKSGKQRRAGWTSENSAGKFTTRWVHNTKWKLQQSQIFWRIPEQWKKREKERPPNQPSQYLKPF